MKQTDLYEISWTAEKLQANTDALEEIRVKLYLEEMSPVTRQDLSELRELLTRSASYVGMLQRDVEELKRKESKRKLRFW